MAEKTYLYCTSPKQKVVVTRKTQSDKEHTYAIVNLEALFTVARELTDRAFKLYSRLNMHSNEYTYALSPVEILKTTGMSESRYQTAVRELIEKGYLVQSADQKNKFTFYEYPARDAPSISVKETGQAPETTVSSGEITQIIHEKPLIQTCQNQGRNTTDITSHNTWDNTVNNTMDSTWLRSGYSSMVSALSPEEDMAYGEDEEYVTYHDGIEEIVRFISDTPSAFQGMGNRSEVGRKNLDWNRGGNLDKEPDEQLIDWTDPDLPF